MTTAKEKNAVSDHKPLSKVNCFSEDGELKEVIFGRVEGFRLPAYDPIYDFVGERAVNLMKKVPNELMSVSDPAWYKQAHESVEWVVDFIKSTGSVVHRPREHTADEDANFSLQSKMNCNLYDRDSMLAIGNTLTSDPRKRSTI
ncbi:MAG: hypothetical protein O7G86_18520 [Gammaproteobacteria bacterium]|nr:hypothetical protein [Gammaproteobacteria bacterium]